MWWVIGAVTLVLIVLVLFTLGAARLGGAADQQRVGPRQDRTRGGDER